MSALILSGYPKESVNIVKTGHTGHFFANK